MTLSDARERLRKKDITALELTDAHIGAVEAARALNAFVKETPDQARDDGARIRCAAAERRGRAARRHSARHQGPVLHQGRAHHGGLAHPRRFHADLRVDRLGEPVARRRRDARQAQQRRVRDGLVERDLVLRAGGQPVAAQGLECRRGGGRADRRRASGAGRLVRRLGGGGRGAALPRRDRDRHRRLDPPARGVHRHGRPEADLRALLALGDRGVCVLARSGGADRAHGARCRAADALDGGARSEGHDVGRRAGAGLRGRARPLREGHEDRHSEGIPARRHAGRDRDAVATGHRVAEGCRRRDGRRVAAAHQVRAAGLLHRGAGGGLVQPRAL